MIVVYILLLCVSFIIARDNFFCFTVTSQSELFLKVVSRSIIDFFKETGFYCEIEMHVFYLNFNIFHSSFYCFHIICV